MIPDPHVNRQVPLQPIVNTGKARHTSEGQWVPVSWTCPDAFLSTGPADTFGSQPPLVDGQTGPVGWGMET
jgi:hypothetical protein